MGRPKSYQVDDAVSLALPAFWKSGYEGTSLKDLEAATALNKFSLYASFGSKRGLYLACLDEYARRYLVPFFSSLDPSSPGAIEAFLRAVVANLEATQGLGCVLLNGGIEFGGADADFNAKIVQTYAVLTGTMARHWNDPDRAEAFTTFVRGLMASGRLGLKKETLDAMVEGSRKLWSE